MENSLKSNATNYGLYLGVALSIATITAYAVDLSLYTAWWYGIGLMSLVIIIGILSTVKSKSLQDGFITFKEAFTSYFITIALGLAISSVVSIVIYNFIDPEAAITIKDLMLDSQVEMMRNFNDPEESIAEVVAQFEEQENIFSIGNVIQSMVFQLIGFSVIGLIVALVMKRKLENA